MGEAQFITLVLALAHLAIVLVAAVLVAANRKPSSAIAWIMAIIFIPFLGAITFLLIGFGRLPKARREIQHEVNDLVLSKTNGLNQTSRRKLWPPWLASAVQLNLNLGALPMVGGNSVELIDDYTGVLSRMIQDIDLAVDHVHVEFFILVRDDTTTPFFDALARASARGVTVRVLADHLSGFLYPLRRETQKAMRDAGIQFKAMLPLRPFRGQWQRPDMRNHRKLVTIDGAVGYTGSQNLIEAAYLKKKNAARGLHWHELMIRITGPVVRELDAVFVTDWYSETKELLALDTSPVVLEPGSNWVDAQVVPSGPSFENDNNLKLFSSLIHRAERRVSITSPYFVPDESTMLAIVTAASRGLEVELFVSAIGDQFLVHHAERSYFEELLRAGVAIYLYRAPTVLHSKHFSIDDDVAVIGSSNMDIRSFSINMEVSVLLCSKPLVSQLRLIEDDYRSKSDQLVLEDWLKRPALHKVFDNLARLTSALQ